MSENGISSDISESIAGLQSNGSYDDISKLRQQIALLDEKLKDKNEQLDKAGKVGLELLSSNNSLQKTLEDESTRFTSEIEKLSQEKFSLQQSLECSKRTKKELETEVESLQDRLSSKDEEFANDFDDLKRKHAMEMNKKVSSLENEINEAEKKNSIQTEQIKDLKNQVKELTLELQERRSSPVGRLQTSVLMEQNSKLKEDLLMQNNRIHELERNKMKIEEELKEAIRKVSRLQTDLGDSQNETLSYSQYLEKSRLEVKELRSEMDDIKLQYDKHNKKGNSLFAEVEDRRIQAEKELLQFRVKYENLARSHKITSETLEKFKMQLSNVLTLNSGVKNLDKERMRKLENELHEAHSEITSLAHQLEITNVKLAESKSPFDGFSMSGAIKEGELNLLDFTEYLKSLIETKEKEKKEVEKKLAQERTFRLATSDELVQTQRRLYEAKSHCEKYKGMYFELSVELRTIRLKYEPEKVVQEREEKEKREQYFEEKLSDDEIFEEPNNKENKDKIRPKEIVKKPEPEVENPVLKERKKVVSVSDKVQVHNYTPEQSFSRLSEGGDDEEERVTEEKEETSKRKGRKQYKKVVDVANLSSTRENPECKTQ
ncbi:DgyrCDS7899 [Dimorphilus gyrociliatus]|uniref:DgyrCDS7899 n=1 Tax=Dimorphilus gyrociliatus TaxID=2664684 RepID=A0A7I8VSM7_9ANNE|nr:DgyrCDS7899 [Dimorphilus gyrociliatus]